MIGLFRGYKNIRFGSEHHIQVTDTVFKLPKSFNINEYFEGCMGIFAVLVSKWIFEWMQGSFNKNNIPYHLQRYLLNRGKIPVGYFSVFNEIVYSLIVPLEEMRYTLPDKLVPDISEGKVFCNWLRKEKNIDPSTFPTYAHEYGDGRIIPNVRLYPNELLPDFREHFNNEWLLQRAEQYFSKKRYKSNTISPENDASITPKNRNAK